MDLFRSEGWFGSCLPEPPCVVAQRKLWLAVGRCMGAELMDSDNSGSRQSLSAGSEDAELP